MVCKTLRLCAAGLLAFSLFGCGGSAESSATTDAEPSEASETSTEATTEATTTEVTEAEPSSLTFGSTFTFDGFDIQIGDAISTTTLSNGFSDKDGATIIGVPLTLTNNNEESSSLNMFYVKEFGSSGTELDTVFTYFDDDVRMAGDMRPGASMTAPLYFLYDGDGTYVIEFAEVWGDPIEVEIPVQLN